VNGAGTPNNFAGAIMKKVVALRQTEKPPTPVMVKAFLGLCRLRVRPERSFCGIHLGLTAPAQERWPFRRVIPDMSLLLPVRNYALRAVRSV
jgi:hypothetical protein